ncbi:hybrid sensor histidine kinase/response regulator [Gracilibacillus massiliensis]|uniref:hybrid sensor histidine kinase/response regulator n=1 Tax=Gracilibacillus massiliensis TaxID=1564956 RepID=UPI00071D4231|nr:ATP-binding protein [Gracilibacillus massiliensis]
MLNQNRLTYFKIFIILIVFISLLVTFRLVWIDYHEKPDQPLVENGILDLTEWELTNDETISLNGEWDFYPEKFINDINGTNLVSKSSIEVPGDWSDTLNSNHPISSGYGYGSYHLKILLPNTETDFFGLRTNNIHTAANIVINGETLATINNPTTEQQEAATFRGPLTSLFYIDEEKNELDIIIQASNYEIPFFGGINKSISFGTDEAITKETNRLEFFQLTVIVIFLLHAFYAFALFFLGKGKSQKELIYFGSMLSLMAIGNLIDDEVFIQLPFSTEFSFRLLMFIFIATLYVLIHFIHQLYKTHLTFIRILSVSNILLSALTLFLFPFEHFVILVMILYLYYFISISYMFVTTLKHIRNGDNNAIFILLFICSYTSNIIWGAAIQTGQIEFPFYPFDFLISILLIAILLFRRHIHLVELTKKQTAKLLEEDKKKDEFLANTSHEIRNPLHGMINIAQAIINKYSKTLDSETTNNLNLLVRIGHQLTFTLNDLLDITRLKEKQMQLNKEAIDLHQISSIVMEMVQFMSDNKSIKMNNAVSTSFPPILADENRIIRILFNLVHNAVKFTDTGSITVSAKQEKDYAIITVRDTGIGISESALERIFLPYEKLSKAETDSGGIGLGLNICRQLVELHDGRISVDSQLGKGTTIAIDIPLASGTELKNPSTSDALLLHSNQPIELVASNTTNSNHPKLLVVDDDPINVKVIKNLLELDYQIVSTTDPREALDLIEENNWDLIIADVMMPHISGYELTKQIRNKYAISELPVLLLTARNQPEDIYAGFRSGANDYIAKPVDALELQARVKALTDIQQSIQKQLHMEAAWLQAQIKPHFIFNTLNTIASLSTIDSERMTALLNEFGNYLYKSFDVKNTLPLVPLKDELHLVQSYIYINKQRFQDRINVEWQMEESEEIQVPPLSIQTLVENALKHGILKQNTGGTITIMGTNTQDSFEITVEDDGVGMSEDKIKEIMTQQGKQQGIGLVNTNKRLEKLFGQGLVISSKEQIGTKVSITIPKSIALKEKSQAY